MTSTSPPPASRGPGCGRCAASSRRQSYPAAVKAACALVGDTTGPVRAPLLPLEDDARSELALLLERAGSPVSGEPVPDRRD